MAEGALLQGWRRPQHAGGDLRDRVLEENILGDAPPLCFIFPVVHLESGKDDEFLPGIEVEADAVLQETETSGTFAIGRTMASGGSRPPQLEAYDFSNGAHPLIRPTEATVRFPHPTLPEGSGAHVGGTAPHHRAHRRS